MTTTDLREWLAPGQAARQLGISRVRVGQLADAGKLRGEKTALGRLIDPESVAERLANRQGDPEHNRAPA
jgi:predicted site-specific integrase-resolvase